MGYVDVNGNAIKIGNDTYLKGKKWVQIGDSLTDYSGSHAVNGTNDGFGDYIARKYECTFLNWGTAGASYSIRNTSEDENSGVRKCDRLVSENIAPDYVTLALGTNDRENGNSADTSADNTGLYGAVRYCIEKIKTAYPSCKLGVILPPMRGTANDTVDGNINTQQLERNNIIKSICELYSVPTCDMFHESNIVSAYLGDGLHLGTKTDNPVYMESMPLPTWLYKNKLESFLLSI